MKAILKTAYGPPEVLRLREVEAPAPGEDEVLIRVRAASINAADYRMMEPPIVLRPLLGGLRRPRDPRFGIDVAGRVEAVGKKAFRFRPGDEVFGCAKGSLAEYAVAREDRLAPKPARRGFEEAAAVPVAALTALQGFRSAGGVRAGEKILIQGASGGVGTFAVQIAKASGAEVTAVCSTRSVETVRSIGADHVIDYTGEDFTRGRERYDLIFAVNGYHPLWHYSRALGPTGRYVCAGGNVRQFLQALLLGPVMSRSGGKRMKSMGIAKVNRDDLETLGEMLDAGTIAPVIDARYSLAESAGAVRYVMETHPRGKVVVTVTHGDG